MATRSLLDVLRSQSAVDCDTLDLEVPEKLGPFDDCTSNQAIALGELKKVDGEGALIHAQLIKDAIDFATSKAEVYPGVDVVELAVDTMMVKLALKIVPSLMGFSHIQTNPKYSYNKNKTVENGQRIVGIFRDLGHDARRVCIKIPATWEGMQACRELEKQGVATLATTLFCMEQAALAHHVGCTYIAPYINELRVHFDPGFVDENKAFALAGHAQMYYEKIGSKTQVLPASLVSIREVMKLAGIRHITVSPPLLKELADTPGSNWEGEADIGSALVGDFAADLAEYAAILDDESAWRLAFTRSGSGMAEAKISYAINVFCDKQDELEELARQK